MDHRAAVIVYLASICIVQRKDDDVNLRIQLGEIYVKIVCEFYDSCRLNKF